MSANQFLAEVTAGTDANAKYPTGLSIKSMQKFTFFPVNQVKTYVRLYIATPRAYPNQDSRTFSSDYTTSIANDGKPQTFENISTANYTTAGGGQSYFNLPWVPISENRNLMMNWKLRKVKTFVIAPGLPHRTFLLKTKHRRYKYEDLNFSGFGVPALNPKYSRALVIETVGENCIMNTLSHASATNTNFFFGPHTSQVGVRQLTEAIYRPEYFNIPRVDFATTGLGANYNALAPAGADYRSPYITHPMPRFGVAANAALHGGSSQNIAGAQVFTTDTLGALSPFVSVPIRIPNIAQGVGNFDHGGDDSGSSLVANAIKTAAT